LDPASPWFGADKRKTHHLFIGKAEKKPTPRHTYDRGIWDGIFRNDNPKLPIPDWSPMMDQV
jgi:hypothetical protein